MNTQIRIVENNQKEVSNTLANIGANKNVFYKKKKDALWNINGADFYDKQVFFEDHLRKLDKIIDNIVEQIC